MNGNCEITLLGFKSSTMNCLTLNMLYNTSVPEDSSSHKMGLLKYPPNRVLVRIYSVRECFKNTKTPQVLMCTSYMAILIITTHEKEKKIPRKL